MHDFARLAEGDNLEVIPISRPFSNFDFVDARFMGLETLRRIMSQVRQHGGHTMVVEQVDAGEIREENEDIQTALPEAKHLGCWRLSFFEDSFDAERGLSEARPEGFIGYAVVKWDELPGPRTSPRVHESVIRGSRYPHNFIHGAPSWECRTGRETFRIKGYPYAQQNGVTNACAHVALKTAIARFEGGQALSHRAMNRLVGIDQAKRRGGDGLRIAEMRLVLEAAGARCIDGDFSLPPREDFSIPFEKMMYGSVESGFPALLVFAAVRHGSDSHHVIPVFGHTFNEDTWVPNAEREYFSIGPATRYLPSETWVSMYLAHDDNWGSNFCIPRHYMRSPKWCPRAVSEDGQLASRCLSDEGYVEHVLATLPKEVALSAMQAEAIGADYLFTMLSDCGGGLGAWGKRFERFSREGLLVLRSILVSGTEYAEHLGLARDWNGAGIHEERVAQLRGFGEARLWMVEMSVPELFQINKRKIAEVVLWADVAPGDKRDFRNLVFVRVPGHFILYVSGGADKPRYQFVPTGTSGHVELYGREEIRLSAGV
jgi:hypothetical protein